MIDFAHAGALCIFYVSFRGKVMSNEAHSRPSGKIMLCCFILAQSVPRSQGNRNIRRKFCFNCSISFVECFLTISVAHTDTIIDASQP